MFICKCCNFKTDRKSHFERHINSEQHKKYQFILDSSDSEEDLEDAREEETSTPTATLSVTVNTNSQPCPSQSPNIISPLRDFSPPGLENVQIDDCNNNNNLHQNEHDEWFPFKSKVEMLLYVFMNSTTHSVSDEIVKYVMFMLKELGHDDLPSLSKLKNKQFGSFKWEDMVTKGNNNENIPVWSVKPSSLLQLMIANPNTSRSVIRHPDTSDSSAIGNPTQAVKWKEEIEFADNSVTLPINLFLDDTATHKSRQWKALHCIQMQLAGLPLHERNKLGSVKFLGATEKADIMDLAQLIVDDIRQLQLTGVESFDAFMNRECVVRSSLDIIIADCAMLSYCCNHLGAAATKFCPRCHADADHFMAVGQKRTPQETKRTIQRIEMRSTETDKKQLRKRKGIKEHKNVLWDFLDPHRDIPVGMLHLIPLGIAKDLVVIIKDQQDEAVVKKMQHHLTDLRPGSDMKDFFKFIRSKQGKHFKNYVRNYCIQLWQLIACKIMFYGTLT